MYLHAFSPSSVIKHHEIDIYDKLSIMYKMINESQPLFYMLCSAEPVARLNKNVIEMISECKKTLDFYVRTTNVLYLASFALKQIVKK